MGVCYCEEGYQGVEQWETSLSGTHPANSLALSNLDRIGKANILLL